MIALSFSAQSGSMFVRIVYCSSAASRLPMAIKTLAEIVVGLSKIGLQSDRLPKRFERLVQAVQLQISFAHVVRRDRIAGLQRGNWRNTSTASLNFFDRR